MHASEFSPRRTEAEPLHTQVSDFMRTRIATGQWSPGTKLPSEPTLAIELGVARGTLRRAVDDLTSEGILSRVHGRGTFVSNPPIETSMTTAFGTIADELREQNIEFTTSTISHRVTTLSSQDWLNRFNLERPFPALQLQRVRSDKRGPIAYLENTVLIGASGVDPQIAESDFDNIALFDRIEHLLGNRLGKGERFLSAVNSNARIAQLLKVPQNTALLHMEQRTYTSTDLEHPVEFSTVHINSSRMRVQAFVSR
ncbi:GntR family transcriptional regulator [Corynebacterium sp. FDAARGOS 1242]|uniref:GntR family transcriptional regulator n=1 Tax=Corynebacterium sp. FDAARGOS 1242 TaxID=2778078 RepID=UPI0021024DA5|nr:GntR family transcriptional regulator [Corynebacterium sp. FDAARGOS 1242]